MASSRATFTSITFYHADKLGRFVAQRICKSQRCVRLTALRVLLHSEIVMGCAYSIQPVHYYFSKNTTQRPQPTLMTYNHF